MKRLKKLHLRGVTTKVEYWQARLTSWQAIPKLDRIHDLILAIPFLSQELKWMVQGKCVCCGAEIEYEKYSGEVRSRMLMEHVCFLCGFWKEKIEDGRFLNVGGSSFFVGPESKSGPMRGHGGALFTILYPSGKVISSRNVWCQGEIPERFVSQFKTAEFM